MAYSLDALHLFEGVLAEHARSSQRLRLNKDRGQVGLGVDEFVAALIMTVWLEELGRESMALDLNARDCVVQGGLAIVVPEGRRDVVLGVESGAGVRASTSHSAHASVLFVALRRWVR